MLFAAKAMALTGLDLLQNPDLLARANEEFDEARGGAPYKSALPDE